MRTGATVSATDIKAALITEVERLENSYAVYGFINRERDIYPIGSYTKVLSTVFELISRPAIYSIGKTFDYDVVEPAAQGSYTSFIRPGNEKKNIVFLFNEYATHLVVGFVYNRAVEKKFALKHKYPLEQL